MNNDQLANVCVPTIHIPSRSVAVVGHEWNLYFENVILCDNILNYDIRCDINPAITRWSNFGEFLRITPTAAGVHTVTLSIYNKFSNQPITSKSFTLNVIEDKPLADKKVIFLGDSLTYLAYYPVEIQYNLSKSGIQSLGTLSSTTTLNGEEFTVRHEGRPGWATCHYLMEIADNTINPFYNPNAAKFDFSYYMKNHGYTEVDAVSIFLGTNRIFDTDQADNIKVMIESIHEYDPNIIVLVNLTPMPASQSGYGYCHFDYGYPHFANAAYDVKYATTMLVDKYIASFDGVMNNVFVSEVYFNLDTKRDYGTTKIPASARNTETEITVQTDSVHPGVVGHLKFADVIYNNLLYHLTK